MASHEVILLPSFLDAYSDIDLVATELRYDPLELARRLGEILRRLSDGDFDSLQIRSTPSDPQLKTCELLKGIRLVFELVTENSGTGKVLRRKVHLLTLQTEP